MAKKLGLPDRKKRFKSGITGEYTQKFLEFKVTTGYDTGRLPSKKERIMIKRLMKYMVVLTVSFLIFSHLAPIAMAEEHYESMGEKGSYMAADLVILRPMGIIATALGSLVYVISLPFSIPGGNQDEAYQKLVSDPAKYTFQRPLGEM